MQAGVSDVIGFENPELDVLTVKVIKNQNPKETVDGVMRDFIHLRTSYGQWRHSLLRELYL